MVIACRGFHDPGLGIGKIILVFIIWPLLLGLWVHAHLGFCPSFLFSVCAVPFWHHTVLSLFGNALWLFVPQPFWLPVFWPDALFLISILQECPGLTPFHFGLLPWPGLIISRFLLQVVFQFFYVHVAHGFMARSIGLDLGSVNVDIAKFNKPQLFAY